MQNLAGRHWTPLSAARTARALRAGSADPVRLVVQFADDFRAAPPHERAPLVAEAPPTTGDGRLDALLAGVVEHLCHLLYVEAPAWVDEPSRFLDEWWFVAGLHDLRALALVESPAGLRRRGVFVTEGFLASA